MPVSPILRPLIVLVADDRAASRDMIEALLIRAGCEVRSVGDGLAAIAACKETLFDLVLMDCQMPRMDGLTASQEIRKIEGTGRRTPIIALTASDLDSIQAPCRAAGIDDILIKPVTGDALSAVFSRWVTAIDERLLNDLRTAMGGSGSDIYQETIACFLMEAEQHLVLLSEAIAKENRDQMSREVHIIKGSSGYFGARGLQTLCSQIESLLRNGQLSEVSRYAEHLTQEFQRVRVTLQAEVLHGAA